MFFLYMKIDCFLFIFLLAFGKLLLQSSIKLLPISDHFLILLLNALLSHILFIFCLLQPRLRLHYIYLNLVEHIVNARRSVFFTFLQKLIEWYFVMLSGALEGCAGMLILSIFQLRQKANIFLHLTASYIILASLLGLNMSKIKQVKIVVGLFLLFLFCFCLPEIAKPISISRIFSLLWLSCPWAEVAEETTWQTNYSVVLFYYFFLLTSIFIFIPFFNEKSIFSENYASRVFWSLNSRPLTLSYDPNSPGRQPRNQKHHCDLWMQHQSISSLL